MAGVASVASGASSGAGSTASPAEEESEALSIESEPPPPVEAKASLVPSAPPAPDSPGLDGLFPHEPTGGQPYYMVPAKLRRTDNGQPPVLELKEDADMIVSEALPGTFSDLVNGALRLGVYMDGKVGECSMILPAPNKRPVTLDFTMSGADGSFHQALFSWFGWYHKRPVYALRSPLNPTPQFGLSLLRGDSRFLWAEGVAVSRQEWRNMPTATRPLPSWYLSSEIGNFHDSQIFAVWEAERPELKTVQANYPAQPGLELNPVGWKMLRDLLIDRTHKNLHNDFGRAPQPDVEHTPISIEPAKPRDYPIYVADGPPDLNGFYYNMGEYLGYPYYRRVQDESQGGYGYVIYRGHVVAGDLDSWVIGSKLGLSTCIRAYTRAKTARYVDEVPEKWLVWDKNIWAVSQMTVRKRQ